MSINSSESQTGRNQVLYTTHSAYFVDLDRFNQLRIASKFRLDDKSASHSHITQYSLEEASQELARITGQPPEKFTEKTFRARAQPIMKHTVNEGFFADVVVLVEGQTEVAALLTIAEILNHNWLASGIAVIPVE